MDLTKWSFIVFSGETTGKLLRDTPTDEGSVGSDDNMSFQFPPVFGGDLSDPDLNEPGSFFLFDVDDEEMPLGNSDDPLRPGPPDSGPFGCGFHGPVPSQSPINLDDAPFSIEPSGPSAGAVLQYSDPDVPLSHPGTNAPPFISTG